MPANYLIRRALPTDLEAILALEQACPEAPHWNRTLWLTLLAAESDSQPIRSAFVAEGHAGILGFAVGSCIGPLAELESLAVSPSARRQGFGRALCQHLLTWSRQLKADSIELEVRASSEGALALYRSLGFTEQGSRRAYYSDPPEDAVLMVATL